MYLFHATCLTSETTNPCMAVQGYLVSALGLAFDFLAAASARPPVGISCMIGSSNSSKKKKKKNPGDRFISRMIVGLGYG